MVDEYLVKQSMRMFTEIVTKLISPSFKMSKGGAAIRVFTTSLNKLEEKTGALSRTRIVDYFVCSLYAFKDRDTKWTINQVLGPKSLERFNSDKGRVYYENRWLNTANITRDDLLKFIADKSNHPQSQYIYLPMEEGTKGRLLNTEAGYIICQSSTLGWSPESIMCSKCQFAGKCQIETSQKYPEIYRLRIEHGSQK